MIKKSLADLRAKLDNMKRNKEAVELGIQGYESKYRGAERDYDEWATNLTFKADILIPFPLLLHYHTLFCLQFELKNKNK